MDKDAVIATLRAHRSYLEGLGVIHAALFGSVARGEAGPDSDIDIAIDLDEDFITGIWAYVGIQQRISALFPEPVDVHDRAALKPHVRKEAARDSVYAF